jgi:hypothetical protein
MIHQILHEDVEKRQINTKSVSHSLTDNQNQHSQNLCKLHPSMLEISTPPSLPDIIRPIPPIS